MMGKARAKPQAVLLLAALVLMSCLATSSSNCIPRRLLLVSRAYYQPAPCNDDPIDRPTPGAGDGKAGASGSRIPGGPPSPTGAYSRAASVPSATTAPPGSNN